MAEDNGLGSEGPHDVPMADAGDGSDLDAGILRSVEQPNTTHTSFLFEAEPESDAAKPLSSSPTAPKMPKSGPKKKGTASTKKGPSRKTKAAKLKASKKDGAPGEANNDDDDSSDDEVDNGPYCLCRGPDDHRWMIGCDICEDWFHGECVDIEKELGEKLIERFVCPNCTDGVQNYTKYKKTCSLDGCTNQARLYSKKEKERSVFCCNDHCDAWWSSMISTLPMRTATRKAIDVLTREDFMGLLVATANQEDWNLGDKPFGNMEGLWANGLPTKPGVLSDEEQTFLQSSAADRLALGNEIIQYKKMMQLIEWANQRRQSAIELGKFTKDSCGYDYRLDVVSVRHAFVAWVETPDGQATFAADKLSAPIEAGEGDSAIQGMCEKKRCKAHNGWYKILMGAVRSQIKETATAAADKLDAEEKLRNESEIRFERRQLENNWVEVLD